MDSADRLPTFHVGAPVDNVAPGWIDAGSSTEEDRTVGKQTPMGRSGTPQEIDDLIAFLASDEAACITGQSWSSTAATRFRITRVRVRR